MPIFPHVAASLTLASAQVAAPAGADDLGQQTYQQCLACHALTAGANGVGPTLHGLLGSRAGSVEGFRFSGPMKRSGIVWDERNLTAFLRNPQALIANTRMPFSGISDETALKALVAYLVTATR